MIRGVRSAVFVKYTQHFHEKQRCTELGWRNSHFEYNEHRLFGRGNALEDSEQYKPGFTNWLFTVFNAM